MEIKKLLVFIVTIVLMLNTLTLTAFSDSLQGVWTAKVGDGTGSRSYEVELKSDGTCSFRLSVQQSGHFIDARGKYTKSGGNVKLTLNYDEIDETTIPFTTVPTTTEVSSTYSNDTLIFTDKEINREVNLQRTVNDNEVKPDTTASAGIKEAFPQHYHELEDKIVYYDGSTRYYSYRDNFKAL